VSGRIVLHLDRGLGWTTPRFVACCRQCGSELARHRNQATAARAAGRRRCPTCGTRTARRLPGTTSPTTDLAAPEASAVPRAADPRRATDAAAGTKEGCHPPIPPAPPPSSTPFPSHRLAWKEPRHGSREHLADRHGRRHLGRVLHGLPSGPLSR
jgi:hypothetical protein